MEGIGTFFLTFSMVLATNNGDISLMAPLITGLTLTAMIYSGAHISGAHFNPAVTLAMLMRGKMERNELFITLWRRSRARCWPQFWADSCFVAATAPIRTCTCTKTRFARYWRNSPAHLPGFTWRSTRHNGENTAGKCVFRIGHRLCGSGHDIPAGRYFGRFIQPGDRAGRHRDRHVESGRYPHLWSETYRCGGGGYGNEPLMRHPFLKPRNGASFF